MDERAEVELDYEDSLLPTCLLQTLSRLWKAGTLCDVVLVAEGREIAAHKVVLAAASPYFRVMFTCQLREASENRIVMQEISFALLELVIFFFYTTQLKITDNNIYELMSVADLLQLSSVRRACASFLISTLNPSNCLSFLTAASLHSGYNDLVKEAVRFARKNLVEVAESEEFLSAPADMLLKVFQGQILNIPNEGFLLKIIIAWVKHDPSTRLKDLEKLTSAVHLLQVPMEILVLTKQEAIVENSTLHYKIKHTINTILEERYDSDVRAKWATGYRENSRRMLRFCDDQEVILAIGGESSGMALGSVECLTLGYANWKCAIPTAFKEAGGACEDTKVIPPMHTARSAFGVCFSDDKIYVAGGSTLTSGINTVEVYNFLRNEWTYLPPLRVALAGIRIAVWNGQLVVTGGLYGIDAENSFLYLDERSATWKDYTPMSITRSFHGLVNVGGVLYALGGKTGTGIILRTMERYDSTENCWFSLAPMHEARYDFGCVAVDQYIYIVGGMGGVHAKCAPQWLRSVERYDTLTNQWTFMSPMSSARASFGISVSNHRIYCVGGFNGINYTNTVEKFNPATNRWHCVQAMMSRRFRVGAATLRVPVISRKEA